MANEYDNTNTGSLFINHKKEDEKHADRQGSINIDGVDYWLNGWVKIIQKGDRKGEKMLSLTVKRKDNQGGSSGGSRQQSSSNRGGDDLAF